MLFVIIMFLLFALDEMLLNKMVKRIRKVEAELLELTNRFASMENQQIEFKSRLDDVRKSLDNF